MNRFLKLAIIKYCELHNLRYEVKNDMVISVNPTKTLQFSEVYCFGQFYLFIIEKQENNMVVTLTMLSKDFTSKYLSEIVFS
jgi:hypothetical protein